MLWSLVVVPVVLVLTLLVVVVVLAGIALMFLASPRAVALLPNPL
jgi:hypothetical protein